MNLVRCWMLVVLGYLAMSVTALAQSSAETDFVPKYPFSTLEQSATREVPDYRLILGQLRIINNEIRTEQRRLAGDLTRLTYQVASGHNSQAVFDYYRDHLKKQGAEILFSCTSRDCGRSSEWATDVFGIANLYGIDREQNYLVARLERSGQRYYVVVYTIQRGNQRVYAHVEVLAPAESGATGGREMAPSPVIPLKDDDFGVSLPRVLADFVGQAEAQAGKVVWVVVHTRDNSFRSARARGETVGRRVKLWLVSRGLAADRIETFVVGPLAPSHDPSVPVERVELFLLER